MTQEEIKSQLPHYLLVSKTYSLVITDMEGISIFVNELFEQKFSFMNRQFIGQPFTNTVHPDDAKKCNDASYQCITNPDKTFKVQVRKPDSNQKDFYWTEWEFSLFKDRNNHPIGILCLGHDIFEKEAIKEENTFGEQDLDIFFKQSLSGFFFMMLDEPIAWHTADETQKETLLDYAMGHHRITKVNKAMLDQYGAVEEEFLGKTPNDMFAHDLVYGRSVWREFFDKGQLRVETKEVDVNGKLLHIEGDYLCMYDTFGRITGHFGVQNNITKQKEKEQQLEARKQQYKELADSITDVFFGMDENLVYTYWNKELEKVMGIKAENAIGKRMTDILPDTPQVQETIATCKRVIQSKKAETYTAEYLIDKKKHFFEISVYPTVSGISVFTKDITDRKASEEQLKISEYKLKAILNSTTEGNILIGSDYKILSFNQATQKYTEMVFGRKMKENDSILDFLLPETKDVFMCDSQKALNGEVAKRDFPVNGFWFEITHYPVYDEQNTLIGFTMNSVHIDERKKAEEYRKALLASIPDLFFVIDSNGVFVDYKGESEDLDATAKDFLNKSIYDILPPEVAIQSAEAIRETLEKHITTEISYSLEIEGSRRFYQARINPLKDEQVILLSRDVTKRTMAEKKLQESELKLQKTIESVPHPLLIVNDEVKIQFVNHEFEKVFGYAENEILGKMIDFLIPEKFRTAHAKLQHEYLQEGGDSINMGRFLPALTKDGEEIVVDASLNTFIDDGKKSIIVILQNVTAIKKHQDTVLQQNETLRKIAWQQSHEVRRPVSNALGLCELLKSYSKLTPEEQTIYLNSLVYSLHEIDKIIHDIVKKIDSTKNFQEKK